MAKPYVVTITFNYDRSLEHYLCKVLNNHYGLSPRDAAIEFPVYHIHGVLGQYPYEESNPDARPYRNILTPDDLEKCVRGIRILHETDRVHEDVEKARQALRRSERICFLGFGFHPDNIDKLDFESVNEDDVDRTKREFYASFYGVRANELQEIRSNLNVNPLLYDTDNWETSNCLDVLRNFQVLWDTRRVRKRDRYIFDSPGHRGGPETAPGPLDC